MNFSTSTSTRSRRVELPATGDSGHLDASSHTPARSLLDRHPDLQPAESGAAVEAFVVSLERRTIGRLVAEVRQAGFFYC